MKKQILYLLTISILTLVSCEKADQINVIPCGDFSEALLDFNDEFVADIFIDLLQNTSPEPTIDDSLGHEKNILWVIDEIDNSCETLEVSLVCYACIKTLPAQSEIKIAFESSGEQIIRIIDIITPAEGKLKFHRIHE